MVATRILDQVGDGKMLLGVGAEHYTQSTRSTTTAADGDGHHGFAFVWCLVLVVAVFGGRYLGERNLAGKLESPTLLSFPPYLSNFPAICRLSRHK